MKTGENAKLQTPNVKRQTDRAGVLLETLAFEVWRLKFGVFFTPQPDARRR